MAGRIFYAGGAIPQNDSDNAGYGIIYTGSKPINISNDTISLSYDNQTIQLNANGELCANLDELGNEIFLEKPKVLEDNSTEIVIAKTQPSTAYTYGVVTSLSIQSVEKSTVECTIEFTAGENISVTYPQSLKTIGNPTFKTGKRYLIAIYNNIMIAGVIDN